MTKKITHSYFPKKMKYFTPIAFAGGIYLFLIQQPIWCVLLILLGVLLLTTNYVTKISLTEKKYEDYLSVLGLKMNYDAKKFNTIHRIVITRGNFSQKVVPPLGPDRTINWSTFTATLIFDNHTLDLRETTDKKDLVVGLKEFAAFLKVGVEDKTSFHHYWIDMTKV